MADSQTPPSVIPGSISAEAVSSSPKIPRQASAGSHLTKKAKKEKHDEPGLRDSQTDFAADQLHLSIKKKEIKEGKKLEKKKEKEEKRKLKEEEKQKEKEVRQKEKEDKRKAEQKRTARRERRKSWLKTGGTSMEGTIEATIQATQVEEQDKGWQKAPKPTFSPEIKRKQRELEQFLLNMPLKKLRGTTWKYFDIAPAAGYTDTLFLLHSGGVRPEAMFEHILGLAQGFRVVAPWFPEVFDEIEDYVAGLFLIMRHENIKKTHLAGFGFGAAVALHFLYRHPGRVLSCSLIHGVLPSEASIRIVEKALKKMDLSNSPLKRLMAGFMLKPKDIEDNIVNLTPGEKELWIRTFKTFSATKQAFIVRLESLLDLHSHFHYKPEDFSRWQGKMLLIESEDDEYYDAEQIQQFKSCFANLSLHQLRGGGYLLSLIRGKLVADLLLKFILDEDAYTSLTSKTDVSPRHDDDENSDSSLTEEHSAVIPHVSPRRKDSDDEDDDVHEKDDHHVISPLAKIPRKPEESSPDRKKEKEKKTKKPLSNLQQPVNPEV